MNRLYLQIYVSMNADALLYVYRTIVVVEHKSHQTMNSREKGQGRECSWKPKKREDRLWREGELLLLVLPRTRQKTLLSAELNRCRWFLKTLLSDGSRESLLPT